jgi:hypothetical protein
MGENLSGGIRPVGCAEKTGDAPFRAKQLDLRRVQRWLTGQEISRDITASMGSAQLLVSSRWSGILTGAALLQNFTDPQ